MRLCYPGGLPTASTYLGGGFGRRLYADVVAEAVQLALLVRWPVKVVWTREQDLRNDWYRPATHNAVRVGLDADGLPVSWSHTIVGPDYMVHGLPVLFQSMLPYGMPRQARNLVDGGFGLVAPIVIAGRKAVEEEFAEALILGCTLEVGFYKQVEQALGVPVIDPSIAALKRAEYAAVLKQDCGWKPSRRWSSESPTEEEMARIGGFDDGEIFGNRIVVPAGPSQPTRRAA